jgi:hypothetical protein
MSDKTYSGLMGIAASLASINNPSQAASLRALAKDGIEQGKGKYQYMLGANGQLVRINKDDGTVDSRAIPGGQKGNYQALPDGRGGFKVFDHNSGTFVNGGNAAPTNGAYGVPMTETNPSGLPDTIDDLKASGKAGEALASQIEGVHRGDIPYPAGGSRKLSPQQQQLKDGLALYHPDMNANDFNGRKKFRETIANTAGNSRGAQYSAYNHSIDLLSQAADNVERLGNSDNSYLPVGVQGIYNNLKNQQNSPDRSGSAKNIDTSLVPALMGEQSKLYYGSNGGGQEERRVIAKALTSGDTLTNQIEGLKTIRDQLLARGAVLEGEADKAYGKGAEAYYPTNDAGRKSLEKLNATIARLEDKRAGVKSAAPAAAKPAATPSSWEDAQKAGWK